MWVRGYGLADSKPVTGRPGQQLNLQAVAAPTPQAAAAVYPANYWYSMIKIPDKSEFPGTGPKGNGIAPAMRTQADWISHMKDGCQLCHQMGNRATREFVEADPGAQSDARRVGPPGARRTARPADERRAGSLRPRARAGDVRRLDRSDYER